MRIWDRAKQDYSVFSTPVREAAGVFAQWINDGNVPNVFNDNDYPWMKPRRFYDEAAKACKNSAAIKQAAIEGIEKRL